MYLLFKYDWHDYKCAAIFVVVVFAYCQCFLPDPPYEYRHMCRFGIAINVFHVIYCITSRCNLKCVLLPFEKKKKKQNPFEWQKIRKIVGENIHFTVHIIVRAAETNSICQYFSFI